MSSVLKINKPTIKPIDREKALFRGNAVSVQETHGDRLLLSIARTHAALSRKDVEAVCQAMMAWLRPEPAEIDFAAIAFREPAEYLTVSTETSREAFAAMELTEAGRERFRDACASQYSEVMYGNGK